MKWIKCSERLPEKYKKVIGWGKPSSECSCVKEDFHAMECMIDSDGEWLYGEYDCEQEVTHWMNLPEEPK